MQTRSASVDEDIGPEGGRCDEEGRAVWPLVLLFGSPPKIIIFEMIFTKVLKMIFGLSLFASKDASQGHTGTWMLGEPASGEVSGMRGLRFVLPSGLARAGGR